MEASFAILSKKNITLSSMNALLDTDKLRKVATALRNNIVKTEFFARCDGYNKRHFVEVLV